MCVRLPLGNLNPGSYPPHPTSIYTCRVTTAPRACGGAKDTVKMEVELLEFIETRHLIGNHMK